jgi:hypothetical protein
MAYEAEDDDLDVEIYEELITYSKIFEEHAWKVSLAMSWPDFATKFTKCLLAGYAWDL